MATNYTPVADGEQATADLFNNVFDQFDDAIGDRTTLTTTEQDSLVGALNEVSDTVGTRLNPDGTLKAGAVDATSVIADGIITSAKIGSGQIQTTNIGADAVTASKILDGNVTSSKIPTGAISTAKIADDQVTNAKMGTDVKVGSLASLLTTVKDSFQSALNEVYTRLAGISNSDGTLKDGAVSTAAKLAADAVTTAKILDANITNAKMASDVKIGSLAALTTTVKTSIQAAINELVTSIASVVTSIANLTGGAGVIDARLKEWTKGDAYELTAITHVADAQSGDGKMISSATVKWPDGSGGTLTVDTKAKESLFYVIDAYHITHTVSGKTVTQAAATRDSQGLVTSKPALTVA